MPQDATGRTLLVAALLLAALVYAGTLQYGFVYDDGVQIVLNPAVQSWHFAPRYFTQSVWSNVVTAPAPYYRPIFLWWCLLNFTLFGLKAWGWHLATVLVHLVVTALVFRLTQRLTRDDVAAGYAALIFGLHPIHIESVAWISGVTDPLLAVFFIGSFLCWLNWREQKARRASWLAASIVLYALAAASKETGVVLPLVIFGYEWLVAARQEPALQRLKRACVEELPFVAVTALYLWQRSAVLHGLRQSRIPLPWTAVPLTWPSLLWFYAHKLLWPVGLSPFYDRPYVLTPTWQLFWLPLLLLVVIAALLAFRLRQDAIAKFSLLLLAAPILPVLEILSLEPREIAHDRYLYLPSFGLAILVALALRSLRWGERELFRLPAAQFAAVAALVVGFGVGVAVQEQYWANDILLFYRAVQIAPTSESATSNLANALLVRGHYDEGIYLHRQLLARDPRYWMSYYNLGNAYFQHGQFDDAERNLFEAAKLQPQNPQLFLFLGLVQKKNGHPREAEANLREAIRIWTTGLGAHYQLGLLLAEQGRNAEAAQEFRSELQLDPDQPAVREALAKAEGGTPSPLP